MTRKTDFLFVNHGSITILTPLTEAAKTWIDENIADDAQTWGGGIVIEHRYAGPILEGIDADGFTIN